MDGIRQLAAVTPTYSQSAYDGMQKSLQTEWTFVQRVVEDIGPHVACIQDAMQTTFLPSLLRDKIADDDPVQRLALLYPLVKAQTHLWASEVTHSHLIQVMRGAAVFSLTVHQTTTQQVKTKLKEQRYKVNKEYIASIKARVSPGLPRAVQRGCDTGDWLSVLPSPMAATELSANELCDSLAIRFGRNQTDAVRRSQHVTHSRARKVA
jgi:hypothetical protein